MAVSPVKIYESFARRYNIPKHPAFRMKQPGTSEAQNVAVDPMTAIAEGVYFASSVKDALDLQPFVKEHSDYFVHQAIQELVVGVGMRAFGFKGSPYKLLFEMPGLHEEFK